MPKVNGKIYYNNVTGVVLLVLYQNDSAWIRDTTLEEDVKVFDELKKVNRNVIGLIRPEWDQYAEDFATQRPVKVINGRIQWQPLDSPPDAIPLPKPFSERLDASESESVITMMALSEAYEMILGMQAQIDALQGGDA